MSFPAVGQVVRPQPSPGKGTSSCSHPVCQEGKEPALLRKMCADARGLSFCCCYLGLTSESTWDTNGFRRHPHPWILFLKSPHTTKTHQRVDQLCLGYCSVSRNLTPWDYKPCCTRSFSSRTSFCWKQPPEIADTQKGAWGMCTSQKGD